MEMAELLNEREKITNEEFKIISETAPVLKIIHCHYYKKAKKET